MSLERGAGTPDFDKDWVEQGTKDWDSFYAFVFQEAEIEIFFAPYQVIYYAAGPQFATIKYEYIAALMRKEYAEALGVEHLRWRALTKGGAPPANS